jgi:hypothetical protein
MLCMHAKGGGEAGSKAGIINLVEKSPFFKYRIAHIATDSPFGLSASNALPGRLVVGLWFLAPSTGVRIPARQQPSLVSKDLEGSYY